MANPLAALLLGLGGGEALSTGVRTFEAGQERKRRAAQGQAEMDFERSKFADTQTSEKRKLDLEERRLADEEKGGYFNYPEGRSSGRGRGGSPRDMSLGQIRAAMDTLQKSPIRTPEEDSQLEALRGEFNSRTGIHPKPVATNTQTPPDSGFMSNVVDFLRGLGGGSTPSPKKSSSNWKDYEH